MPSRRAMLRGSAVAAATLLAGCSSDDQSADGPAADDPAAVPEETPEATDRPTPTQTPADGPTAGSTPTPTPIGETTPREPVGTGRNPADVVLTNGDDRPWRVGVTARPADGSRLVFDRTVRVEPGGRHRLDLFDSDAVGAYVLQFGLPDGTTRTYEWDLAEEPEGGWLSVGVSADGRFVVTYAMA